MGRRTLKKMSGEKPRVSPMQVSLGRQEERGEGSHGSSSKALDRWLGLRGDG